MEFQDFISDVNNFHQFNDKLRHHIKNNLIDKKYAGFIFEQLSFFILKNFYLYSNNFKDVYLFNNIPQNIFNYLKLPKTDKGLDLLAIDCNDQYFGIQCKFRSNRDKVISWDKLSTFPALTFTSGAHIGVFITNTYDICNELDKSDKIININGDILDKLDNKFFNSIKYNNVIISNNIIQPFDYQRNIITKSIDHFKNNDKGKLIMACGTGKTLTSLFFIKESGYKNIIVIVPSLLLLSQFLFEWINNFKFNFTCVCSEVDDKINGMILIKDDVELLNWINKTNKNEVNIIFSTYQSGKIIKKAINKLDYKFDICIYDEAHKTTGNSDKLFNILLDEKFNVDKKLFLTATEKIYNGIKDNIYSMDNKNIYGEKICELNIYDAIQQNLLTDFQIIIPVIYDKDIKKSILDNDVVINDNEEINKNLMISAVLLLKSINEYKTIKKIITYHSSVNECEKFMKIIDSLKNKYNLSNILCQTLTGKDSMRKRKVIINNFTNNEISILCTAKALTEGVNIKCVDTVCFVSKKNSICDIVQSVGRALRKYEGKTISNIIIPDIISQGNRNNDKILTIINALKILGNKFEEFYFEDKKTNKIKWSLIKSEYVDKKIEIEFDLFCDSIESEIYEKKIENKEEKKFDDDSDNEIIICENCNKKYLDKEDLINHLLGNKKCCKKELERLYKENKKCNKNELEKLDEENKIVKHLNIYEEKSKDEIVRFNDEKKCKNIFCPRCGENFKKKNYLNKHLNKEKLCVVLYYNLNRDEIINNYDKYDFSEIYEIKQNITKNNKFKCVYCNIEYDKLNSLNIHKSKYCKYKREVVNSIPIKYKKEYAKNEIDKLNDEIKLLKENLKNTHINSDIVNNNVNGNNNNITNNITNNVNISIYYIENYNQIIKNIIEFDEYFIFKEKKKFYDDFDFINDFAKIFIRKKFIENENACCIYTEYDGDSLKMKKIAIFNGKNGNINLI